MSERCSQCTGEVRVRCDEVVESFGTERVRLVADSIIALSRENDAAGLGTAVDNGVAIAAKAGAHVKVLTELGCTLSPEHMLARVLPRNPAQ